MILCSLVRLLAVAVGGLVLGLWGLVGLCLHVLCGPLCVYSYERLRLAGGLVICKVDLVR